MAIVVVTTSMVTVWPPTEASEMLSDPAAIKSLASPMAQMTTISFSGDTAVSWGNYSSA